MSPGDTLTGGGPLRRVGLAGEGDSPENPGRAETRVALTPAAVRQLVDHGCSVAVQDGAGVRAGFSNETYRATGAVIVSADELYAGRDLVVKLKGPSHGDLSRMDAGSTLCCMAHVRSIPTRAAIADAAGVNLLAMELIAERPEVVTVIDRAIARSRQAAREILARQRRPAGELSVAFAGFSIDTFGALQQIARGRPRALAMLADTAAQAACSTDLVVGLDERCLADGVQGLGDVAADVATSARKIECLHLAGRAGAGFGLDLVLETNARCRTPRDVRVSVLGYGNVAFGALDECVRRGVARTDVLTRRTTRRPVLGSYLRASDLIINGIDRPASSSYVVRSADLGRDVRAATVVVDLVGGSSTNRSVIEPLVECTHPDDPYIFVDGVYLSAVWGWPVMGFADASLKRYSDQILGLLLLDERLIDGWDTAPEHVRQALVAGPLARGTQQARVVA